MPMITVDQQATFTAPPIAIAVGPRLKYDSTEQDITRDGERKWTVQAAVTYTPDWAGGKGQAEVIEVTLAGEDPAASGIAPGTPVDFAGLRCGVMAAEKTETGRVRGGKLYWQAATVRPVTRPNGNGSRPAAAAARAE